MQKTDKYTFALISGDKRMIHVAENLLKCGHKIKAYGLNLCESNQVETYNTTVDAIHGAQFVILPFPVLKFGLDLECLSEYCENENVRLVFGGIVPEIYFRKNEVYDYGKDEKLLMKNAILTARGAYGYLLNRLCKHDSLECKILVCGYGRIGKHLCEMLLNSGYCVTVAARRISSCREAEKNGLNSVLIDDNNLSKTLNNTDIIVNTVPHMIFNKEILSSISQNPLYIELASFPGGIDQKQAEKMKMKIVALPGIPGKEYPQEAGDCIFESIASALYDRGIEL